MSSLGKLLEPKNIPEKQVCGNDSDNESPVKGDAESTIYGFDESGVICKEIVHESVLERRETTTSVRVRIILGV